MTAQTPKYFSQLPDWLMWIQYGSWFRYGYEIMVVNQWKDVGSSGLDDEKR